MRSGDVHPDPDLVRRVARLRADHRQVLRDERPMKPLTGRVWADELLLALVGWSLVAAVVVWS
jgi:hypothetical protein